MLTSELGLGRAADLFCAAKDAEGLSPRTIGWYRMILDRLVARFGAGRSIDELNPAELRAWLVELRPRLAPVSIAGYVRGLRAVGNWLLADGLADARGLRTLARPRVPRKVMEPLSDDDLRRLLAVADVRDRAILLLLLDTGLRVSAPILIAGSLSMSVNWCRGWRVGNPLITLGQSAVLGRSRARGIHPGASASPTLSLSPS
jgi:integrase